MRCAAHRKSIARHLACKFILLLGSRLVAKQACLPRANRAYGPSSSQLAPYGKTSVPLMPWRSALPTMYNGKGNFWSHYAYTTLKVTK